MVSLNPREIAEVYRLGLLIGFFRNEGVIAWADSVIAHEEHPDQAIIQLSVSGSRSPKDLALILSEYTAGESSDRPYQVLLGLISRSLAQGNRTVFENYRFISLVDQATPLPENIHWGIIALGDDLDLAQRKIYGSIEDMGREIARFLARFERSAELFDSAA